MTRNKTQSTSRPKPPPVSSGPPISDTADCKAAALVPGACSMPDATPGCDSALLCGAADTGPNGSVIGAGWSPSAVSTCIAKTARMTAPSKANRATTRSGVAAKPRRRSIGSTKEVCHPGGAYCRSGTRNSMGIYYWLYTAIRVWFRCMEKISDRAEQMIGPTLPQCRRGLSVRHRVTPRTQQDPRCRVHLAGSGGTIHG